MSGRVGVEQTPDIETVLAAHRINYHQRNIGGETSSTLRYTSCDGCDWRGGWHDEAGWEAHVAQALAPVLAAAVREARAAELRKLADDIDVDGYGWTGPRDAARFIKRLRDRADRIAVDAPEIPCPTCGPTTHEQHPRRAEVQRCSNCKEWLVVDGAVCDYGFPDAPEGGA